ncbi:hypothetical protein BDV10DRAFT_197320 [Aspergillus recurvatus]
MTSIAITVAAKSSLFEQANPPLAPITSAQWKYALQEIKLLYIQKQYKRCVARSSSILAAARKPINPIYRLYLHFYSAICYEAMGMCAHEYSSKKVPLLREALGITDIIDKTLDCPDDDPFLSDSDNEDITDTGFGAGLGVDSEDRNSIQFIDEDDAEPELGSELEHRLVPSPLQVRKSKSSSPLPLILPSLAYCNGNGNTLQIQRSQPQAKAASLSETKSRPRPLPAIPHHLPFNMGTDVGAPSVAYTYTPEQSAAFVSTPANTVTQRHMHNYNSNLSFLHSEITNTITHLQALIQEVTAAQQARNASRRSVDQGFQRSASFWSFSPVKNTEKKDESTLSSRLLPSLCPQRASSYSSCARRESIQDRITRLRAEGWETVGLRNPERAWKGAEYYSDFCGMVLDELYLG